MRGGFIIGSLCRSQVAIALGLIAGVYLIAISFFPADTSATEWRRGHFYGAYFVDDRRLQSIDEPPAVTPALNEANEIEEKKKLPVGKPKKANKTRGKRVKPTTAKTTTTKTPTTTTTAEAAAEDTVAETTDLPVSSVATTTTTQSTVARGKKKPSVTKPKKTENSDTIFFRTAVLHTQIKGGVGVRITSLQECGNKRTTKLRIGQLEISLRKTTVHTKCPWFFAPHCNLVGYYATGAITSTSEQEVPLPPRLPSFAEVYDNRKDEWKQIELIDGRSTPTHAHRLAVCLQPMYLMADWPLIPNFFETWISNGATIFYIYVHSVSEEVDLMIRLYEAQRDIEVVRVDWPAVPTSKPEGDDRNPNNRMYRTEVGTAINDCILRARATADLVVSSDLDEIITPLNLKNTTETLLDVIEDFRSRKLKRNLLPGAFLFRQSFAYAENNWFSINHPSQLNFDSYKSIDYETKVWARGYRSKVIYVPDRVFRAHVHDVVAFESKRWTTVVIDPDRARILHFRQVKNKWMERGNVSANSGVVAAAATGWQAAYAARLEAAMEASWHFIVLEKRGFTLQPDAVDQTLRGAFGLTFGSEQWPNLGEQVLSEIESCRDKNDQLKKEKCVTEWACRSTMETLRPSQWVEPTNETAWVVI